MRKAVLLYGLLGGALIALLQTIEYRYLVVEHSIEIYGVISVWLTFVEVFPIGVVVVLVSAGVLSRKHQPRAMKLSKAE